jgi:hypothetical protein
VQVWKRQHGYVANWRVIRDVALFFAVFGGLFIYPIVRSLIEIAMFGRK